MNGQWMGSFKASNGGFGQLVLDLDPVGENCDGLVWGYPQQNREAVIQLEVSLPKGESTFKSKNQPVIVERGSGRVFTLEELTKRFNQPAPTPLDIEWQLAPDKISFSWKNEAGITGEGEVTPSAAADPSELIPSTEVTTWEQFKAYASKLDRQRYIFRGQEKSIWKLRTYFHRTGRANVASFMLQDVPALHRHLSAVTTHQFNMNSAEEYAAFLNLAQHHGYPTPFLDWTNSPFIAAYFAYNNLLRGRYADGQRVRIHVFKAREWNVDFMRAPALHPAFLHVTVLEPLAINNPRVIPQQSISFATNIDDIEKYIRGQETITKKQYLTAIDLPVSERKMVMRELDMMGINAGSLFPGLDGACGQLRERFFDLS